jgi:hypothetical protein
MDRFALESGLREACARVVAGQRALLEQRVQIRELEQCGHDAATARALLRIYEQSQATNILDRNRLYRAFTIAAVDDREFFDDDIIDYQLAA